MKISGVTIRIHPTFIGLLLISVLCGYATRALLVFGLVLLHEGVHSLAARGFGVKINRIELYPYGGAALLDDTFEGKRREETVIAFAGPAFNGLLFLIIAGLRWEGVLRGEWSFELMRMNFWLGAFNLIPVLPLDGGRIVRAFFAGTFGFVNTTKFLAGAGKWLGVVFVFFGFLMQGMAFYQAQSGLFIILGVFFWVGSRKEIANAQVVFLKQLCRKKEILLKRGLMSSCTLAVVGDTPLGKIIGRFRTDRYSIVHVISSKGDGQNRGNEAGQGGVEKVLSETEIVQAMIRYGITCRVGEIGLP